MSAISPAPLRLYGERNFRLDDPKPTLITSRTEEDQLTESHMSSTADRFVEGAPHPRFPGMILDTVRTEELAVGLLYRHAITALGDSKGTRPTKVLNRGQKRTLAVGWDEIPMEYLSWHAHWKAITAEADTEVISCPGHGYANGQRVMFADLVGGTNLTPLSATALGTVYFVIAATPHTFKVSATAGGSAVNIGSDVTAGNVCAAEFVPGAKHPDYPHMWLVDIQITDRYTDWKRAAVMYRGMMREKPFHRIITCNGQTVNPSNLTVAFDDGFTDKPNAQVSIPKVVCTDTYLTTTPLATDEIPLSQSEGATPPDPPDLRSMVISAPEDSLTYIWPNGWTRPAEEHLDTIPLAAVHLKRRVSEFVYPVMFA